MGKQNITDAKINCFIFFSYLINEDYLLFLPSKRQNRNELLRNITIFVFKNEESFMGVASKLLELINTIHFSSPINFPMKYPPVASSTILLIIGSQN